MYKFYWKLNTEIIKADSRMVKQKDKSRTKIAAHLCTYAKNGTFPFPNIIQLQASKTFSMVFEITVILLCFNFFYTFDTPMIKVQIFLIYIQIIQKMLSRLAA